LILSYSGGLNKREIIINKGVLEQPDIVSEWETVMRSGHSTAEKFKQLIALSVKGMGG
jgi:hypothetical protein